MTVIVEEELDISTIHQQGVSRDEAIRKALMSGYPSNSKLNWEDHRYLIENLEELCSLVNVPPAFLHKSASTYCTDAELTPLKNYNYYLRDGEPGLLYIGGMANPLQKFSAMAAMTLRNLNNTKLMHLSQAIQSAVEENIPKHRIVFIPNFATEGSSKLQNYPSDMFLQFLYTRFSSGLYTVLYASNQEAIDSQHSKTTSQLTSTFRTVGGYSPPK